MIWVTRMARNILVKEDGVTAIEYALIAMLIALAIVVGVTAVGTNLLSLFQRVVDGFP